MLRKLASEAADNGVFAPELAAAIGRVKGAKRHGHRTGNWLTPAQAEQMLALPDRASHKGQRDRALLSLLIGCGLRREELALLAVDRIQLRAARWVLVDLVGKGQRVRTVPMPAWTKQAIDQWTTAAGIASGRLLRAVNVTELEHCAIKDLAISNLVGKIDRLSSEYYRTRLEKCDHPRGQ